MSFVVETALTEESRSSAPMRRGLGLEHVNTTGLQTAAGSAWVVHSSPKGDRRFPSHGW